MTQSRAPEEPAVTSFETTIERKPEHGVVLSETYFYPEAGGQPADRGQLGNNAVLAVQERDGEVIHTLDGSIDYEVGDQITGQIDPTYRRYCQRAHSASHVLYGAARRLFEQLGYGGFNIGDEKIRVDLETDRTPTDEDMIELERLANRAVWSSRTVSWEEVPVEQARSRSGIAFNTKTEEGVMADADSVRIVTIEGWDQAACGGTHVSSTAEIGPVELIDRSNPGKGLTRFEYAVGPAAINRRATIHETAVAAAEAADSQISDLPDAIDRLTRQREQLESEITQLRSTLLESKLATLEQFERNDHTWAVGSVGGMAANDVTEPLKRHVGEDGPEVAVLAGTGDAPFVAVASTGVIEAGSVVTDITDEFGGGGGGSQTFAQGGGLDAVATDVIEYLRVPDGD